MRHSINYLLNQFSLNQFSLNQFSLANQLLDGAH